MRMRTKWFKNHNKGPEQNASALAFIFWQIAIDRLRHLRTNQFQVFTPQLTVDVLAEMACFLVHLADREFHEKLELNDRNQLLQLMAKNISVTYADNALDALGPSDHASQFIDLLNQRLPSYSEVSGTGEGLRYALSRLLGSYIEKLVLEKDKQWIAQQVIEIEIPEILSKFDKAIADLTSLTTPEK